MSSYMWVQNGKLENGDKFRTSFVNIFSRNIGTGPTPRDWRQMATAISREYILPHLLAGETTTSSDKAALHSTNVSHMHYARNGGDQPTLSNDSICESRATGEAWHITLGVGKHPPSPPVRFLRQQAHILPPDMVTVLINALSNALPPLLQDAIASSSRIAANHHEDIATPTSSAQAPPSGQPSVPQQFSPNLEPSSNAAVQIAPRASSFDSYAFDGYDVAALASLAEVTPSPKQKLHAFDMCGDSPPRPSFHLKAKAIPNQHGSIGALPSSYSPRISRRKRPLTAIEWTDDEIESDASCNLESSLGSFIVSDSPVHSHHAKRRKHNTNPGCMLVQSSSQPPMAEALDFDLVNQAKEGLRTLFKDPQAKYKSKEQLAAVVHLLSTDKDIIVVLKTSGGKSAIWQVIAILEPKEGAIVMIPFVMALEEQLQSNLDKGIPSWKYRSGELPPEDTLHIFCQPEQYRSPGFQK